MGLGFHQPDLAEAFHEIVLRSDRGLGRAAFGDALGQGLYHDILVEMQEEGRRVTREFRALR